MDPVVITALTSGIVAIISAITGYIYKSRCTNIECCCGLITCIRKPLSRITKTSSGEEEETTS